MKQIRTYLDRTPKNPTTHLPPHSAHAEQGRLAQRICRRGLGLVALLVLLSLPAPAQAGAVLDQQQLVYNGGTSARILPGYTVWQSFTAGLTGTLVEINMGFFNNMSGQGTLRIYSGRGPQGPVLQTLIVPVVGITQTPVTWNAWTVNVPVTAGIEYTFELTPDPLTLPDPYGVAIGANNPYSAGTFGLNDPSGSYETTFDAVFQTFVSDGSSLFSASNATITSVGRDFIVVNGGLNAWDHVFYTPTPAGTTFTGGTTSFLLGELVDYTGTIDAIGACEAISMVVKPIPDPLAISPTSLATAHLGMLYTLPVSATGGVPPLVLTVSGLPSGLAFDGASISGSPTVAGVSSVTLTATDARGDAQSSVLSLSVVDNPISFSPALPNGQVGMAYAATLTASGGYGSFSFGASGLPPGLTLSGSTISGIPASAGTFTVSLTAIDSAGLTAGASLTLLINPAPTSSYTIKDEGKGKILAVGADYVRVGTKIIKYGPATTLIINNNAHTIHVGDYAQWKGLRDKATGIVLASTLEIN